VSHARIAAALTAAGFRLIESLDEGSHSHFAFGPIARRSTPVGEGAPQAPLKNLLAADDHGTLRLDLERQPQVRGTGVHGRQASRRIAR
jgi:hypothetical protein